MPKSSVFYSIRQIATRKQRLTRLGVYRQIDLSTPMCTRSNLSLPVRVRREKVEQNSLTGGRARVQPGCAFNRSFLLAVLIKGRSQTRCATCHLCLKYYPGSALDGARRLKRVFTCLFRQFISPRFYFSIQSCFVVFDHNFSLFPLVTVWDTIFYSLIRTQTSNTISNYTNSSRYKYNIKHTHEATIVKL